MDDPNVPRHRPRRQLPAIFSLGGSGLSGGDAPYLSATIALAVCSLVWYAFKQYTVSASARA